MRSQTIATCLPALLCLTCLLALCGQSWADCDADCLDSFTRCKAGCTGVNRAQCAADCLTQSESCAALCNPSAQPAVPHGELLDRPPQQGGAAAPAPPKTTEEAYQDALTRAAKTDTCASFCGGRARRCVDGCGEGQGGGCAAECSSDAQVCQAVCYARQQRERREQRQAGPKKK